MINMTDLDLENKRVLIREDLNVPIVNGQVTSVKRLEAVIPTIQLALRQRATVILMSHLGRPREGEVDPSLSLAPVAKSLSQLLGREVIFCEQLAAAKQLKSGAIGLLENTRFQIGEKNNNPDLARRYADLCDVFVMDAFATAHRKEASTYGVAEFAEIACAGPLLVSEIQALQHIMNNPAHPLVAIVGGSKVSTKLSVLKNLLAKVDCLIVGGGIANTFLAAQGFPVGKSLYEPELLAEAREMLAYAKATDKLIPLPVDVVVADQFDPHAKAVVKKVTAVKDELILDVGPLTRATIAPIIEKANTILWNGPLGVFEFDQFGEGTKALALSIANSSAYSVAGGGDTLAAIEKYQIENNISYISTGGGAFLELLEGKQLPAIAILEQQSERV